MAGKGIEIDIAANTRDFQKGTKNVESALDDVADSLDDITKHADKAGDKLGDELSDGAKDAERSVEKLEHKFKDVADASKRETGRAGDAMKKNSKDATSAASRDLGELKGEALQNASETFSSFDGSVESLADGIQGTLGGVISNIGPVGAAAGAAAAIGIGLITAELQKSAERAAEIREETSELVKEIVEAGGSIDDVAIADKVRDWSLEIADNAEWWEVWQTASVTNMGKVQQIAADTGISVQDMFNAMSGQDSSKSIDLLEEMESRLKEVDRATANLARAKAGGTERGRELTAEKKALEAGSDAIRERLKIQDMSVAEARVLNEVTAKGAEKEERAAAATEARTDAMNALQSELDEAVGSWSDYVDAETGATDPAAYIANMQARMNATSNFNSNVQQLAEQFGLSFEETQAILDQGVDFAPMLQAIIDGGPEMQRQYAEQMRATVDGGQAILDGTDTTTTVTVKGDTTKAEKQLKETAKPRDTEVTAEADTKAASRELHTFTNRNRRTTVDVGVDTAAASRALDRFIRRKRTATVTVVARDREGKYVP